MLRTAADITAHRIDREPSACETSLKRRWRGIAIVALALYLLSADVVIKLVLMMVIMSATIAWLRCGTGALSRFGMMLGGFSLFAFAYVVSPYWCLTTLPSGASGWLMLTAIVLAGLLWSLCFGRKVEDPSIPNIPILSCIAPVVPILLYILPSLFASLAWRGDESTFVARLWACHDAWTGVPLAMLCPPAIAIILLAVSNPGAIMSRPLRFLAALGGLALVAWSMSHANAGGELDFYLRRYPFLQAWLHAATTWSPWGWQSAITTGPAPTRLLSIFSFIGLVVWLSLHASRVCAANGLGQPSKLCLTLALATVPVVVYYAASAYIELSLILLMVWICCDADHLLESCIRRSAVPATWIGLAVLGFVKETAAVFCIAVVCCALLFAADDIRRRRTSPLAATLRVGQLIVVVTVPVAVYLYFRSAGPALRYPFHFSLGNFTEPQLYVIFLKSLWQQCGLLLVFSGLGLVASLRARPRLALFCLAVLLGYFLLYYGDTPRRVHVAGISLQGYLGHSRFNLYFIPPLIALAWQGIGFLSARSGRMFSMAAVSWLVLNLWMSPVAPDGTCLAGWGDYLLDTSGYHYPYAELYRDLSRSSGHGPLRVAVVGRRYGYDVGDRMYARKFRLDVEVDSRQVGDAARLLVGEPLMTLSQLKGEFDEAARSGPEYIIIHQPVWGPRWDHPATRSGYRFTRAFTSGELRLILYREADATAR